LRVICKIQCTTTILQGKNKNKKIPYELKDFNTKKAMFSIVTMVDLYNKV